MIVHKKSLMGAMTHAGGRIDLTKGMVHPYPLKEEEKHFEFFLEVPYINNFRMEWEFLQTVRIAKTTLAEYGIDKFVFDPPESYSYWRYSDNGMLGDRPHYHYESEEQEDFIKRLFSLLHDCKEYDDLSEAFCTIYRKNLVKRWSDDHGIELSDLPLVILQKKLEAEKERKQSGG